MGDGSSLSPAEAPLPARLVSIVFHPFVLVPLTVAAATRSLLWTAVVAASSTLPVLAVILRNVRSGRWSDVDVSRQDQRRGLYYAGFPFLLLSGAILYLLGAGPRLLNAVAAGALMFVLGFAGNRWLKISLHLMFAGFCGVMVADVLPTPGRTRPSSSSPPLSPGPAAASAATPPPRSPPA